jgi:hypothetical protein
MKPPKPLDCLDKELTGEEGKAIYLQDLARLFENPKDFERIKKEIEPRWNNFISKLKDGDKLFLYNTPQEYWDAMSGRKGFIVLRNDKMIAELGILQN